MNNPKKNLVFTSAGDNTSFHKLWINPSQDLSYDIYVYYYGEKDEAFDTYASLVKFATKRKGSKFQNFLNFYNNYPEIIKSYERFFILDDDIIIRPDDINKMFEISEHFNLSICQPSFRSGSKIAHSITAQRKYSFLRYTNFVEVNVPLFNRLALGNLMKYLDPSLIGWGIDFLSIWANGVNNKKSYAIVDSISCINPHDNKKTNKARELSLLKDCHLREKLWLDYSSKIKCPSRLKPKVHSKVK